MFKKVTKKALLGAFFYFFLSLALRAALLLANLTFLGFLAVIFKIKYLNVFILTYFPSRHNFSLRTRFALY